MSIVDRDVVLHFGRCQQQHGLPFFSFSSLRLVVSEQVFRHNGCQRLGIETFVRPLFGKLSTRIYGVAAELVIRGADPLIHWTLHVNFIKKFSMDLIHCFFVLRMYSFIMFTGLSVVLNYYLQAMLVLVTCTFQTHFIQFVIFDRDQSFFRCKFVLTNLHEVCTVLKQNISCFISCM